MKASCIDCLGITSCLHIKHTQLLQNQACLGSKAASMASSIPEQAIDARRAAVEEVEKLLQHPEDLKRLPDMLEEYMLKVQVRGPGRAQT